MDYTVNLFNRYEHVLFEEQLKTRTVSCIIVTGYLGAGKTTIVNHLLRHKSDLRLAVLVNEVGSIDIDGQLVSLQQTNAAVGTVSRQLAGGCACCEVIGDLQSATKELLYFNADLDYLVLETSGAADVEPMVEVMREAGLQVDGVVAVVDAEAALQQLESGVAVQQVQAADLVVLNKCDLASLGQMATAEDRIRALAPSTAIVRARHAQVDPLLLFSHPASVPPAPAPAAPSASMANAQAAPASVTGEVAFMSHESAPVLRPAGSALATTALLRSRQTPAAHTDPGATSYHSPAATSQPQQQGSSQVQNGDPSSPRQSNPPDTPLDSDARMQHHHHDDDAAQTSTCQDQQQQQQQHGHDQHRHRHHHHQEHSVATRSFSSDRPLSLAWFQRFVTEQLLPAPGLLRAKGFLWFLEEPGSRFTFHVSGRRRVECHTDEAWSCPPGCQLVLIGQSAAELEQLCHLLEESVAAGACGCHGSSCSGSKAAAAAVAGAQSCCSAEAPNAHGQLSALAPASAASPVRLCQQVQPAAQASAAMGAAAHPSIRAPGGAQALGQLISQHPRFALVSREQGPASSGGSCATAAATQEGLPGSHVPPMLVEFTVVGSPLHGVFAEAVNADVLVKVNGSGQLLLSSRKVAGAISSTSLRQNPFRSVGLLLAVEDAAGARAAWALVERLAAPVLRKAFAHVHNCGCDVHSEPM